MLSIVAIGLRVAMLVCSVVVLGLSAALGKEQVNGPVPPETGFSSFAGGFALIACLVGVAGLWVTAIPGLITMVLDGISAVIYLVAGIVLTSALKSISSCTSDDGDAPDQRSENRVTNFGCTVNDLMGSQKCIEWASQFQGKPNPTVSRCQRAVTDYSFEYIGFMLCVGMVFLGYVLARRGGSRPTVAAQ
ncbi:hypothetical protein PG996_002583, partial [Apiospora saccharicola]